MTTHLDRMRERIASLSSSDPELHKIIEELSSEIEELKAKALGDNISTAPVTDNANEDVERVYSRLASQRVADLIAAYNKAYFEQYSEYTRFVIAKALCKLAADARKEPSKLWVSLVNTAGLM